MSECMFPPDVSGSWVYFETPNRTEHVTVIRGDVMFTSLGKFMCKARHWDRDWYKMVSYYNNGWWADCCRHCVLRVFIFFVYDVADFKVKLSLGVILYIWKSFRNIAVAPDIAVWVYNSTRNACCNWSYVSTHVSRVCNVAATWRTPFSIFIRASDVEFNHLRLRLWNIHPTTAGILLFAAKSSFEDLSFDLCRFEVDTSSILRDVGYHYTKTLIRKLVFFTLRFVAMKSLVKLSVIWIILYLSGELSAGCALNFTNALNVQFGITSLKYKI